MKKYKNLLLELHYSSYFDENFDIFRKKYSKLLKKDSRFKTEYYVSFTNHQKDVLEKKINRKSGPSRSNRNLCLSFILCNQLSGGYLVWI